MNKRTIVLRAIAGGLAAPAIYLLTRPEEKTRTQSLTLVSNAYRLDKIYHSMEGPYSLEGNVHIEKTQGAKTHRWIISQCR